MQFAIDLPNNVSLALGTFWKYTIRGNRPVSEIAMALFKGNKILQHLITSSRGSDGGTNDEKTNQKS